MNENNRTLLLIEDNPGDVRLIQESIMEELPAADLTVCHSLSEGKTLLSSRDFDLILLDLTLPDSRGIASFKEIHRAYPALPVIIISGVEDKEVALKAVQSGAQDYITKTKSNYHILPRAIHYAIERHEYKSQLIELSITDNLTKLHNRRGFFTLGKQQIRLAKRNKSDLLLFFIDLNQLKKVNDQYGHAAGDQALKDTATILKQTFRDSDVIARVGGDEFAVLAVDASLNQAQAIIERLRKNTRSFRAQITRKYHLNFSIGVAAWKRHPPQNLSDLIKKADAAMYQQKREEKAFLPPESRTPQPAAADAHPQTKLLLVEDNPGDAHLVKVFLEKSQTPYELNHTTHLAEAIEKVQQESFALILLDLALPDSHGLETVQKMAAYGNSTPLIVMTAQKGVNIAKQALKMGAQDFITKGQVDEYQLNRSIQHALERHQLRMETRHYAHKLEQSEARFRTIIEENADGILLLDKEGTVFYANATAEQLWGVSPRELEGATLPDLQQPLPDKPLVLNPGEENEKHLELQSVTILLDSKTAYLITAREITDRIQKQKRVRLQAAALQTAANAIAITDPEGNITWINPAFLDLTGYSQEEVIGKNMSILNSGKHAEAFYREMWATISAGKIWQGILINKKKNGSLYHEEMTISPLRDETGTISHYIAVKNDITNRIETEKNIQERVNELSVLHEVAAACVEETEEDALIERVTRIIGQNLYSDHFGVMLLDKQEGVLRLHPSYQGLPVAQGHIEVPLGEGISGDVAQTGHSRLIPDINQTPEYIQSSPGMRSELCVPLMIGENIIGVINAESKYVDAFNQDDERLLVTLAGQISTAIERIRNYRAEKQQRLQAEALSKSAITLNSTLELDQIMNRILDNIARVVPYETASILEIKGEEVHIIRHRGFDERQEADFVSQLSFSLAENQKYQEIIREKTPLIISDTRKHEEWMHYPETAWIRSHISVPIVKGEEVFGFLGLDHSEPEHFTQEHGEPLLVLAHQLATAVENARLYSETQQKANELARLYQASETLLATGSTDIKRLAKAIVHTILEEFGQANCSLLLVNQAGQLERIYAQGPYSSQVSEVETLNPDGPGIVPTAYRKNQIQNVPDVTQHENYLPSWKEAFSEMALPLSVGSEVLGVLDVQSSARKAFREDDERVLSVFAEKAALAIQNVKYYEGQQRQLRYLNALHQIDLAITGSMNLDVTLSVIVKQILTHLSANAVSILTYEEYAQTLTVKANAGFAEEDQLPNTLNLRRSLPGVVIQKNRLVSEPDLRSPDHPCQREDFLGKENLRTYYGFPLISKGKLKGVMEVFYQDPYVPNQAWKNFAETIATQTAIAIDNASLFRDLQRSNKELVLSYDTTLEGWAQALELRDHETEGHSRRVGKMTLEIAREMNVPPRDLVHIRRGALLHDIGKMGVPDQILQKPGPLTEEETEIMRKHPEYAFEWLKSIPFLEKALAIPHYHHERWDGAGYPKGLQGDEIPLPARIFAIVDVWDALLSDRPYRKAWSQEKTLNYLREQAGKQFDPQVVEAFFAVLERTAGDWR